jgi:outer membrane usher protein
MACGMAFGNVALAGPCASVGLVKDSVAIMQLQQAGQDERTVITYRNREQNAWFIPLLGERVGVGENLAARQRCNLDAVPYWMVAANDPALTLDNGSDTLAFIDLDQATNLIEARKQPLPPASGTLDSLGVNYQLALDYSRKRLSPSVHADWFAYRGGWYFDSNFGLNTSGKIIRFESYALKENLDSGISLRLGDAVSYPTPLGESVQFAGVSWGTDRHLRPGDFAPVLPTLRNGSVIASPLEVFINDTLQFQQMLQSGVYDVRNIPAQNGFNSYTIRTTDALGIPVIVQRQIYLPESLLPPGTSGWQINAGFRRANEFTDHSSYGAPFVASRYATGITHDVSLGGYAMVSKDVSTFSGDYDQRLSDLWTGHLGLLTAHNLQQQGHGAQARVEGGGQLWRLFGEWTHAFKPLPSTGNSTPLVMQRLLRAQWNGLAGWTMGATLGRSQRELVAREDVGTLSVSTHVGDAGANVAVNVIQTRSAGSRQNNVTFSLIIPLEVNNNRSRSIFASQTNANGIALTRAQYNNSAQAIQDASWNVGVTHGVPSAYSSTDGAWAQNTDRLELQASALLSRGSTSGQVSLRSGLLWTGGSVFATRPVTGAFALVSTKQEGVDIFHENRSVGKTDANGLLLVPDLLAMEPNRLSVDPATWPLHWLGQLVEKQVMAPRGGGVLVSFKINGQIWAEQPLVHPVDGDGKPFPVGSVVTAVADGEARDTVINKNGDLWIDELLPAEGFFIIQPGRRCRFLMPSSAELTGPVAAVRGQCDPLP